jgi:hypothetical protein
MMANSPQQRDSPLARARALCQDRRMNSQSDTIRLGLTRLGLCSAALWLVFWTFAYVMKPLSSENAPPTGPAFSLTMAFALLAVILLAVPWVVSGFRSNY